MNWRAIAPMGAAAGLIVASNFWLYSVPVSITAIAPTRSVARIETEKFSDYRAGSLDLSKLTETFERPLFSPDRRRHQQEPAVETTVEEAPPQPPASNTAEIMQPPPTLIGVSIGTRTASALLRFEGQDQPLWLRVGDTAGGWVVSDIGGDQAVLEQNGQSSRLMLYPRTVNEATPGGAGVPN